MNTKTTPPITWDKAPTVKEASSMTSSELTEILEHLDENSGESNAPPEVIEWIKTHTPGVSTEKAHELLMDALWKPRQNYIEAMQRVADRKLREERKKSPPSQSVENIYSNLMDRTRCLRALAHLQFVSHKDVELPYQTEVEQDRFTRFSKAARDRPTLEYWFGKWDAALKSIESKMPAIDLDEMRQRLIVDINKPPYVPTKQEIRKEQCDWEIQCGYNSYSDDDIRKQFADRHNNHVENMTKVLAYLDNRTELFPTTPDPALLEKSKPKMK